MQINRDFSDLKKLLQSKTGKAFVLCDENTYQYCYQKFTEQIGQQLQTIILPAGEASKSLGNCELIWKHLLQEQATKDTLLINLGGGVITDIGGFAAAAYKRGIKYINIPTSLLAMVDAAYGGKTGVNFEHYKNSIGVFHQPEIVIIHGPFLQTLAPRHIKNGYAEMLKHAILKGNQELQQCLQIKDLARQINQDFILQSLAIKAAVVQQDPTEKGLRKILNLGHTLGHAIEYVALENNYDLLHGEAIAIGLVVALKLSVKKLNFESKDAEVIIDYICTHYQIPNWLANHHSSILKAVMQDKKNTEQQINMVLIKSIGKPQYDIPCSIQEIEAVLKEM